VADRVGVGVAVPVAMHRAGGSVYTLANAKMQGFPPARETRSMPPLNAIGPTALLLVGSNLFMTFAWYGHLKTLGARPWYVAVVVSWGLAFFEYLLQVPANRLGYRAGITLPELKILQEVITLTVFVPFAMLYMGQAVRWNYAWAALCMVGAVYFIFKG